jgi:hypothetical protein
MAFFGRLLTKLDPKDLKSLRMVRMKQKVGMLDRVDKQDRLTALLGGFLKNLYCIS